MWSLKKPLSFVIIFFVTSLFSPLKANYKDVRFNRIGINDGLSVSSVYCIYQDSKGFMWFSTEDGLNKYDGKNFTVYVAEPNNANSLSYKWIELIYEDNKGIFWFGSRGGLTRFDPATESFRQYKNSLEQPYKLTNDTITDIYQISENELLVGTINGLDIIDLETKECREYLAEEIPVSAEIKGIKAIDSNYFLIAGSVGLMQVNKQTREFCKINIEQDISVTSIDRFEDKVWIGTTSGIYYYNFSNCIGVDDIISVKKIKSLAEKEIKQFLFDNANNMWVSTSEGLYLIDSVNKAKKIVASPSMSHSLALINCNRLLQDEEGNIWYATHGDGLYRINRKYNEIDNYKNNPCDNESLSENSINSLFLDRSGSIWIGTYGAGISIYNKFSQKFKLLRNDPMKLNSLASNFVWSILEDNQGRIWIGTNDKGISIFSPKTGKYSYFDHRSDNPKSLSNSSVRCIYEDSKGTIWVGTDGGGLNKYNAETNSFKRYLHEPANSSSISSNSVRVIYEDSSGQLWIGTRKGLNRFDADNETFKSYLHVTEDTTSLSHNFVYSVIFEDTSGGLWIGTYGGGLNKFNAKSETFECFKANPENENSISDDIVFSVVEDTDGMLWIGTNSGLNKFNPLNNEFTYYGMEDGLPNEVVYGIVPDKMGNLWLSTNNGVCRFNPQTGNTLNYSIADGLQSNEFNGGAFHLGRSGKIYFGGVYGLNIFEPELIGKTEDNSQVVFTRLEILGNNVAVRASDLSRSGKNKVFHDSVNFYLQKHISYSSEIEFDYKVRYFSFEFVDLGNINATNTTYSYIMEGLDENWHNSHSRNFVSYANMKPGRYRFKVRSQHSDGSWSNKVSAIDIHITPPFWKTWWFIIFELFTLTVVIYSIYSYLIRLRTLRILKVQNALVNNANKKLKESEHNLKLNNATKDKFFSIISHDLKNPLTSLLSISEMMSSSFDSFEEEEKKNGMSRIHGSIKHIYNLLENLLTWSRVQSGRIQFNPSKFNLSNLLQENYNLYVLTADKKGVKLKSNFSDDIMTHGDRDMIYTVVRNLLNNSIKFTAANNAVEIGVVEHPNETEVYVRDEGVGISEENLKKLFRIDKKLKTEGTEGEKGTGLGLIVCHEFVEMNKGRMKVTSEIGKGSRFSFTLPLVDE